MPRYDKTGPMVAGAGTGWGRGNCVRRLGLGPGGPGRGDASPAGQRRGRFGGRFSGFLGLWRGSWGQSANPASEAEALRAKLTGAKQEIAAMEARLADLEKKE